MPRGSAWCSGGFLALLLLVALTAPWITPFDVAAQDLANSNAAPGWPHLLGTDEFGRDVLSRILYGARTSLSVSATAIAISMVLGMALGAAAGYFGGLFERAVMTVVDLTWSFPDILIALMLVAIVGPGLDQHDVCHRGRLSGAVHAHHARPDRPAEARDLHRGDRQSRRHAQAISC